MGFTTYDSIISALSGGFGRHPSYQKISITTVANAYFSLWNIAGIPAAGAFGTALTARVIDNTFAAAMPFTDPTGGRTAHLLGAGIRSTVAAGVLVLVDRLLEAPFDGTATSGTFNSGSPLAIPSRDANGAALG